MKQIVLLLTLFSFSFTSEKWEYLIGEFSNKDGFMIIGSMDGENTSLDKYSTTIEEGDKEKAYYTSIALQASLNKMGADGWELITIAQTALNSAKTQWEIKKPKLSNVYYFKRIIPQD